MKKKKDKISRLLDAYVIASGKRLAKEKKREAVLLAKENKQKLLEAEVRKKIIDVFRLVMKQLISRLDKDLFEIRWDKMVKEGESREGYVIKSIKEKEVNFYLYFGVYPQETKPYFAYEYYTGYKREDEVYLSVKPKDINEDLIKAAFITCLKKISE